MAGFVDDQIHAVDQMPLVGIVGAPEEIQTSDEGHYELRDVCIHTCSAKPKNRQLGFQ